MVGTCPSSTVTRCANLVPVSTVSKTLPIRCRLQVAGFVVEYDTGLIYATIKGAGENHSHTVYLHVAVQPAEHLWHHHQEQGLQAPAQSSQVLY
jgi:hypothetical protein